MKKERIFELVLIVAIMAGAFYAAFSDAHNFPNRWFTRDDAYYYFKVAQNVSEGLGSTFDGVNVANGYHPLWMLVNIPIFALARFDLILPLRILLLLMAAMHALSAVLLFRIVSRTLSPLAGSFMALFWGVSLYIHKLVVQFGLETGLTVLLLFLFLYKVQDFNRSKEQKAKEIVSLAILATLLMFSRLDMVFLVLLFGVYLIFRKTYLRYFLLADIFGVFLFAFLSFLWRVGVKDYYLYEYPITVYVMLGLSFVISVLVYYFAGLYQDPRNVSSISLLKRVLLSVLGAQGLIIALIYFVGKIGWVGNVPRSALLVNAVATLIWALLTRFGVRWLARSDTRVALSPSEFFQQNRSRWFREGLRYYGIVGLSLLSYMVFNQLFFGSASPVSGQVKRWWGSLSGRVYGGHAQEIYHFFGVDAVTESDYSAWGLLTKFIVGIRDFFGFQDNAFWIVYIVSLLVIVGILLISLKRTVRASVDLGLLPLLVAALIQPLSYHAGGYSAAKEWYWVTQYVLTALLLALLADALFRATKRLYQNAEPFLWAGVFVLGILWGQSYYQHLAQLMPYGAEHVGHPYMEILSVVEENTEPGAMIGMTGGGNLGYFIADRTIVNMDGLINSYDYFTMHKDGRGDDYLAEIGLDYVFANPAILADLPYKGEFVGRLGESIANYGKKELMPFYQTER